MKPNIVDLTDCITRITVNTTGGSMTQAVVTRFDTETVARLTELAKLTGRTRSYYIKEAVLEHLSDMEMIYLAKQRSEDIRAGRTSTIPWEDVKAKHGVQD